MDHIDKSQSQSNILVEYLDIESNESYFIISGTRLLYGIVEANGASTMFNPPVIIPEEKFNSLLKLED